MRKQLSLAITNPTATGSDPVFLRKLVCDSLQLCEGFMCVCLNDGKGTPTCQDQLITAGSTTMAVCLSIHWTITATYNGVTSKVDVEIEDALLDADRLREFWESLGPLSSTASVFAGWGQVIESTEPVIV